MALSATIDITSAFDQLVPNQPANVVLSVYNPGASTKTVTTVLPYVLPIDGGAAVGVVDMGIAGTVDIAAAATHHFSFKVVFFAPQNFDNAPDTVTYTLGAVIYDSDGAVTVPVEQSVVVVKAEGGTAGPTPSTPAGQFDFTSPLNSANEMLW